MMFTDSRIRTACLFVCLTGLLFHAGCSGFGKQLEPPKILLVNLLVQNVTLFETTVRADLRVLNANDVAITIKGIDCHLELLDKKFASGVSNTVTEIPSYGSAIIPITVYSNVIGMIKTLVSLKETETLTYKIKGRIRLGGDILLPPVIPFSADGEWTLEDFKGGL